MNNENNFDKLDAAVAAVMEDVKYLKKDGTNDQQGYKFTSAEHIIGELREAALKHGLRIAISYADVHDLETGETRSKSAMYRVRVKCELLLRKEGQQEVFTFYGEGADTGDKALPKAKTMCLKQALRQLFLIETGEADADRESPDQKSGGNPKKKTATERLSELPDDVAAGFAFIKSQPEFKDVSSATFRSGVITTLDTFGDDMEKVRAYLASKGYGVQKSQQAKPEKAKPAATPDIEGDVMPGAGA